VSIGTLHGLYRDTPKLDFDRLAQIRSVCPIPLVLHGGSDTPDQDLRRAIEIGIDKINIWTDVRIPFLRALKETLSGPIEKIEVSDAMSAARAAAGDVIRRKNRLLGSVGKASLYG
jgi:fructose/tagatose bisphosphate aldolase